MSSEQLKKQKTIKYFPTIKEALMFAKDVKEGNVFCTVDDRLLFVNSTCKVTTEWWQNNHCRSFCHLISSRDLRKSLNDTIAIDDQFVQKLLTKANQEVLEVGHLAR